MTTKSGQDWLTREQVDTVIAAMSAADLIAAMGDATDTGNVKGPKMAGDAFDSAANRLGLSNGTPATAHVRMQDFQYLAQKISEAINIESPTSEGPEG